jgi:hypothetical protein
MQRTEERPTTITRPLAPVNPPTRVVDTLLPQLHRRHGIAAILRDERLEIAIADDGSVVTRMVAGTTR